MCGYILNNCGKLLISPVCTLTAESEMRFEVFTAVNIKFIAERSSCHTLFLVRSCLNFVWVMTTQHPSIRKSRHYFADSGGRSVGIVRLRTKATEFLVFMITSVMWCHLVHRFLWNLPTYLTNYMVSHPTTQYYNICITTFNTCHEAIWKFTFSEN
jgi:hypothetical protein